MSNASNLPKELIATFKISRRHPTAIATEIQRLDELTGEPIMKLIGQTIEPGYIFKPTDNDEAVELIEAGAAREPTDVEMATAVRVGE